MQAGTIEVTGGNLSITVSFAPGTLSPQTGLIVYLDIDEDARTGSVALREDNSIGADYVTRAMPDNGQRPGIVR